MEFKDRLKMLREETGMTQKELAKAIKINNTTISDYERGDKKDPYMSTLRKLANYFDVTIDYLIGESDEREMSVAQRINAEVSEMDPEEQRALLKYMSFIKERGKGA